MAERAKRSSKELWDLYVNEEVEEVFEETENTNDHTLPVTVVLKDAEGRFWQGYYQISPGSDYNEWREGYADDFQEVFPKEVTTVVYE